MNTINKLKIKLEVDGFNQDYTLAIMILFRETLEELNLKNQYEILNFYGNWCVHEKLTLGLPCFSKLLQISQILHSNPNEDFSSPWYNDAIANLLNLKGLRQNILDFSKNYSLKSIIWETDEYWKAFHVYLRNILVDKPITFPTDLSRINRDCRTIYDQNNYI